MSGLFVTRWGTVLIHVYCKTPSEDYFSLTKHIQLVFTGTICQPVGGKREAFQKGCGSILSGMFGNVVLEPGPYIQYQVSQTCVCACTVMMDICRVMAVFTINGWVECLSNVWLMQVHVPCKRVLRVGDCSVLPTTVTLF